MNLTFLTPLSSSLLKLLPTFPAPFPLKITQISQTQQLNLIHMLWIPVIEKFVLFKKLSQAPSLSKPSADFGIYINVTTSSSLPRGNLAILFDFFLFFIFNSFH